MTTRSTSPAHNPGPWLVSARNTVHLPDGSFIADVGAVGPDGAPQYPGANARLIAAAPDLLEACNAAADLLTEVFNSLTEVDADEQERYHRVFDLLDAATAKAEGRP